MIVFNEYCVNFWHYFPPRLFCSTLRFLNSATIPLMVLYLIVHKDCFMVDFCYLGEGGVKLKLENYNTTSKIQWNKLGGNSRRG